MTCASGANAAIVAASMKAERRIVQALRDASATSSDAAAELKPDRLFQRGVLRRLVRRGAVRQTGPLYWLDEAAFEAMTQRRRSMGRLVLGYAVGVAVALIALAIWMRPG